ncbi:MAG TPA: hypothetical protein VGO89_07805 [Streptomyces sp.]|nr:hypothetical protein [Streptomyces sp.]
MSTEPPTTRGGTPSADEQPARRRRRQLSVVAVAAAVLMAGGGGAYWASTAGSSDGGAGQGNASEPPQLALDGLAAGQSSDGDGKDEAGIAPGEPNDAQIYKANKKLPEGPGKASVYRTPTGVPRESVAALAKSLGVSGTPEKEDGRWQVGEGDGSDGLSLTVNDDRMAGNWTYQTQDSPVMPCGKPLPTVPSGDAVAQGPGPGSEDKPVSCPAMPDSGKGDPVSEEKAKGAVEAALKTLKQKDAALDASATTGSLRMVTATPEVDGMATKDWNSTFTVGKDGKIVRGHGNLGELRKGASYPVMTAKETLQDLNKQGATGTNGGSGTLREPAPDTASGSATEQAPGKAAPRKSLKVTDAEFGLVTRYTLGKPVLVPSWIYKVELQGGEHTASVAHPAVQPEYLKPTRPSQPGSGSDTGSGSDSDPGSGSGSGQAENPSSAPVQAVNSYETDGRTVKLTFWGGVCGGYKASAKETGKLVEVTVRPKETDRKKVCVKMAKRQTVEVELDKALGDRKLLDAQDGKGVPRAE